MNKPRLLGAVCAFVMTMASVNVSAATVDQSQLLFNNGSPFEFSFSSTTNYPLGNPSQRDSMGYSHRLMCFLTDHYPVLMI